MNTLDVQKYGATEKKILIVDDYESERLLMVDTLTRAGYLQITQAENGFEAIGRFQGGGYDLVISDVMMPGMGGLELLKRIRKIDPITPVILITAHPETEVAVSAIKTGAVDFLPKPFKIEDLLFKVNIYLRERKILEEGPADRNIDFQEKLSELSRQSYIYDSIENSAGHNEEIFQKIVDLSLRVVDGSSCAILLVDREEGQFYPQIVKGEDEGVYRSVVIPQLRNLYEDVLASGEAVMVHSDRHPLISPSVICAPLMIRNMNFGILVVRKKMNGSVFSDKDFHYIVSLTKRASLNLENKVLYESLYSSVVDTLKSLVASVQVRDHYTEEHSTRVMTLALRIGEKAGCSEEELECLKISAMLHDVGKIAIPDSILLKPDRLTFEEFTVIKTHPLIGENILKPISLFDRERKIIQHHHERWGGKGYPGGLSGKDIPFLSRILAVADSFDAMTNNRPYRNALSLEIALEEMKKNRYVQFDGEVVDLFLPFFEKGNS